jgi:hypothetical protein
MPRAKSLAELFEGSQWAGAPAFIDDGTGGSPMPVGATEEVDEVDAEGLFSLAHLPLLGAAAFELLAESAHLVG